MKKILFVLLILQFLTYGVYASNIFYASGSGKKKQIALTFDDGPGANTQEILEILKDKDIKATFFLLGTCVKKRPQIAKEIYENGHEIANHTYSHINFFKYNNSDKKQKINEELLKCEQEIERACGYKTKIVRFPYGFSRQPAISVASENGYFVVNWSFGCDWQKNLSKEKMLEDYTKNIKSGAIFLMHTLSKNEKLAYLLPKLIDNAQKSGYEIVTISELLELK